MECISDYIMSHTTYFSISRGCIVCTITVNSIVAKVTKEARYLRDSPY